MTPSNTSQFKPVLVAQSGHYVSPYLLQPCLSLADRLALQGKETHATETAGCPKLWDEA